MTAPAPFSVMAKPVGPRCNLECRYCYYADKEPLAAQPRMTDAALDIYVRQYREASAGPSVQFTWHGGEPTLAGLDFYRRAVCNGGCPKDRLASSGDGGPRLNYLCAGLKRFFSHAEKPLKKIARQLTAGARPEAVMSALRQDMRERWRGVGRNDPCPCGSGRKAKHCCWHKRL